DQPAYYVEARGPHNRKLTLYFDANGALLKKFYECEFSVKDNRLYQEDHAFTIRSICTPNACNLENTPKAFLESISCISYVGGNFLVADLSGLTPDGAAITPEADKLYKQMIERLLYIKLGCMFRLFGPDAPQDPEIRLKSARTVAEYFKGHNQFIFWIDGPDAAQLAQAFKEISPELVVAAPGADLEIVKGKPENPAGNSPEKPAIYLINYPPENQPQNCHFLLTGIPRNFFALEEWNTAPEEKLPWKPNNSVLSAQERKEGFIALFDGKTTNGWIPLSKSQGGFIIKDGTFQRKPGGGGMRTIDRFDDFILRYEYKIEKGGNSGVQVRCPRSNRASKIGFEVQILGDYGKKPDKNSTGAIYDVLAPTVNASKPEGQWNSIEVRCKGSRVRVILNGKKVQDVNFDKYEELKYRLRNGFIFLTDHGNFVAYRNIRIKRL
ncbi:MAG: 3-keto-disaccharide hydrolase, partial [Candidatus Hinthialibacter sp.]